MVLLFASTIAALALAAPTSHDVTLDHSGQTYRVSYRPVLTTRMRTIGAAPPSRPSSERCRWTASISIERALSASGAADALQVELPGTTSFSGSQPGHCTQARAAVEAQIAARTRDLQSRLAQVAAQDLAGVRSQIDEARGIAGN